MKGPVLVVDDNPANLKLACDVLEASGFEVLRAMDAASVILTLKQQRPALILMDMDLPDIDGLTLTKQIKQDPEMRGITIVALTAFAMKGDDQRIIHEGCDGYISKPINTRTLPLQVSNWLK